MNIAVCVKQVIDPEARPEPDPTTGLVDESRYCQTLNPADECALEEALRVKDRVSNSRVTVFSLGSRAVEKALAFCLAVGADDGVLLEDEASRYMNSSAVSWVLSGALRQRVHDVVFCGNEASDDNQGYVGAGIAEHLGVPFVSSVIHVDVSPCEGKAMVLQRLEKGDRVTLECQLPAVFAVDSGANTLRYPRLRNRLRALNTRVPVWTAERTGIPGGGPTWSRSGMRLSEVAYPRARPKAVAVPDPNLSGEDRLRLMIEGGKGSETKGSLFAGSPEECALAIARYLEDLRC